MLEEVPLVDDTIAVEGGTVEIIDLSTEEEELAILPTELEDIPLDENLIDSNIEEELAILPTEITEEEEFIEEEADLLTEVAEQEYLTQDDLSGYALKDDVNVKTGEIIAQYRVVCLDSDSKAVYANSSERIKPIGISLQNASVDADLLIRPEGTITNDSWNFDSTKGLFLGNNGLIVQELGENDITFAKLGRVLTPTKIYFQISNIRYSGG